jgi:HAD superfamily hydrolase (TIGR01450 family)
VKLADAQAIVFDVDGTLVLSDDPNAATGGIQALPGAVEVLQRLRARHTPFVCFTNGSSQPPRSVAAKLRQAGLDVADAELLTPPVVAAEYIRRRHPGQLVLAFGDAGVLEPLRQADIQLARLDEADQAGVVLVGGDQEFTYAKLEAACRAVWAGAPLLVTSMAPFFASRRGRMPSPSGAIAAGIRHATGVEPRVLGKPSQLVMEMVAAMLGTCAPRMAVVGDDLELEIRMARTSGAFSVLVLSGSAHETDLGRVAAEHRPDLVVPVVGDLLAHLGERVTTAPG